MSPGDQKQESKGARQLRPVDQEYVDVGELLELDDAVVLSGWTRQEVLLQPIAWVDGGHGRKLFCRASLLAVMALCAAPNWSRPRKGPSVQRCEQCGDPRGSSELLLINGVEICGDCQLLATLPARKSTIDNTGLSGASDRGNAPGSTIEGGAPPYPTPGDHEPPEDELPGLAA